MASTTYEAIRSFWALKAKWLIPVISTWSATGQTTYGIDTRTWTDTASVGLSAETLNNMWIFQNTDSVAGDRKRQIGGNSGVALDTTNARIYPKVAWANAPQENEEYEIHAIDPQVTFDLLVDTLEQFFIPNYNRVAMFTDADMAVSGVTNWTASGAASLSKVTTAANNDTGAQSLFFNAGTGGENIKSVNIRVLPSRSYEAFATVRVDAGGPAQFAVWDETNNVELESSNRVGTSHEGVTTLRRMFTTSSTTEEITLRIYVTNATDDVYVMGFGGPRKTSDMSFPAPATMESGRYLRKLLIANFRDSLSSDVFDARSREFHEVAPNLYHLRAVPQAANPFNIELKAGVTLPWGELWVERLQKVSEFVTLAWTAAGETSPTIPLPKALIGYASLLRICDHILMYSPTDSEVLTTKRMIMDQSGEYMSLIRDYNSDLESPPYIQPTRRWSLSQL